MPNFELPPYNPEAETIRRRRETTSAALEKKCSDALPTKLEEWCKENKLVVLRTSKPARFVYASDGTAELVAYEHQTEDGTRFEIKARVIGGEVKLSAFNSQPYTGDPHDNFNHSSTGVTSVAPEDFVVPSTANNNGVQPSFKKIHSPIEVKHTAGASRPNSKYPSEIFLNSPTDLQNVVRQEGSNWASRLLGFFFNKPEIK